MDRAQVSAAVDPRRWRALGVCVTALFMTLIDISIVTVALPSIGRSAGAGTSQLQWLISGYALAFGMVPIIGGRLGDDRGRRRVLLFGIAAFVVCSAAVGLAPGPAVLIAARVLQGLAGGLINPQVSGLVQQLFAGNERGRAFGVIGAAVGIATAAGPVLGGVIIALGGDQWGWRLCFLVNVPVGVMSFLLCRAWLPASGPRSTTRPLDFPGVVLLAVGLFGLLYPAVEYESNRDPRLAWAAVPALAVIGCFVAWERGPARRRGHPLIDIGLFALPSFADGVSVALLFFCGYAGTPLVLAWFLQAGLGFDPLQSGLTASSYAIGAAISAPVAGRLLGRLGQRVLLIALFLFTIGVLAAAAVAVSLAGSVHGGRVAMIMAGPLLVAGLGGGSVITPNQALSLADVEVAGGSTAGGMLQTAQRIGNALGAAVLGAVFFGVAAGAPVVRAGHEAAFGRAYAWSMVVAAAFALSALALTVRDVRAGRRRALQPAS